MTEPEEGNVTQPSAQKKQLQSLVITGACLGLIVVGLALVSNKLLDKFDIANDPGLTNDQRKEKAQC